MANGPFSSTGFGLEYSVEEVANASRHGSKGTIEGPYYLPNSPEQHSPNTLSMRDDEPGTPLLFQGQITNVAGQALPRAKFDLGMQTISVSIKNSAPGLPGMEPPWRRGDGPGRQLPDQHHAACSLPDPYDGACGQLIAAAGWHVWRPAHLHLKVSAPGISSSPPSCSLKATNTWPTTSPRP